MSVTVALAEIPAQIARFGPVAFLVTVGDDGRPHPASVRVAAGDDGTLRLATGRRTGANLAARPDVTVLWAGPDADGFALLVDGCAALDGDGAARITPSSAILHKLQSPA